MTSPSLAATALPRALREETPVPGDDDVLATTLKGLGSEPRTLPSRLFYDALGMTLFNRIRDVPEYYITRQETALVAASRNAIRDFAGNQCAVVELGAGSEDKAIRLLHALDAPYAYIGVDVSRQALFQAADIIQAAFPKTRVGAVIGDFSHMTALPKGAQALVADAPGPAVGFLPGSTIGNLDAPARINLLSRARTMLGAGSSMLLGLDLIKAPALLHAAYNDAAGATAAFNLNILHRIRRETDTDLNPDAFRHLAFYNPDAERVEMHLESTCEQVVHIGGHAFTFAKGARIHTENSHKFSPASIHALADASGWHTRTIWTPDDNAFALIWLDAA